MMKQEMQLFNEENGEIIFSVLAKANTKITTSGFNSLKQYYTMINSYKDCQTSGSNEFSLKKKKSYIKVTPDSQEVLEMKNIISMLLQDLENQHALNVTPSTLFYSSNFQWLWSSNMAGVVMKQAFAKTKDHVNLPLPH